MHFDESISKTGKEVRAMAKKAKKPAKKAAKKVAKKTAKRR
jgi:hypothetical protein